jgi:hypothetical protein
MNIRFRNTILFIIVSLLFSCGNSVINNPNHFIGECNIVGFHGKYVNFLELCDSDTNIYYINLDSTYYSSNNGEIWTILENNYLTNISDIKINSTNPDVVYAFSYGLYKSSNAGSDWIGANPEVLEGYTLRCFTIDKSNPNIIYAGSSAYGLKGTIYKSSNGGKTWNIGRSVSSVIKLKVNPIFSRIVYAGMAGDGVVYYSKDGGFTWGSSRIDSTYHGQIIDICCDYLDKSKVYVTAMGVYRSQNYGRSWENISIGLPNGIFVSNILSTTNGRLFACAGGGLYEYYQEDNRWYSIEVEVDDVFINDIDFHELSKVLYLSTNLGLYSLKLS